MGDEGPGDESPGGGGPGGEGPGGGGPTSKGDRNESQNSITNQPEQRLGPPTKPRTAPGSPKILAYRD